MKIATNNLQTTPFLIIGSGIAGLYTALKLSELDEVTLLTKETLAESNTSYAQGGIAAAVSPADSPELHFQDTIKAGAGLCLPDAVKILVNEGPERVKELMQLGVPFDTQAGKLALTREAAHCCPRVLHADGDATGRQISQTLIKQVLANPRIKLKENSFVAALLTADGRCYGALALDPVGRQHGYLAKATVLATGGCGQIFADTTNPQVATGDGMAIAFRAGAPLADLEFVQFHPTALYLPEAPRFLITEAVRGEGGILRNQQGVRFMPSYHEAAELAPRDVVARSLLTEMGKTGTDHVYLHLSALEPSHIKSRFPNIYETCLAYGLDITKEPIPVAPAMHYMMGGIATDLYGRTALPHLFACGEVACPGVHGANRLASNSLLDGLVFGHRIFAYLAGQRLASLPVPPEVEATLSAETALAQVEEDRQALKALVGAKLGIIRREEDLLTAAQILTPVVLPKGPSLTRKYLELQNMRLLARLMVNAALQRTESRGGHFRADYPTTDPKWEKRLLHYPNQTKFLSATTPFHWNW
ncbi:MAG: L-aspartate oxidase [Firmicutes bacterium]|nr:L-aspartate oxidase [Bacillota bacterium]